MQDKPIHVPNCVLLLDTTNPDNFAILGAEGYVCTCGAEMQDDAGKTPPPETPRWEHHFSDGVCVECQMPVSEYVFALEAALREAEEMVAFWKAQVQPLEHFAGDLGLERLETQNLEVKLREAEKERDSAIDALTTTQADWTEERQQLADEVSAYQIKLREAEALAAQMQEKWHRSEMLILEDADELELLREEAAEAEVKAVLFDQLKVDAQLLLIECDAKTAALLQIVRRRAGNPAFEWMRQYAMNALTEEDHKQDQEWVDALTADALPQPKADRLCICSWEEIMKGEHRAGCPMQPKAGA